jgi:hypothetical protein
MLRVRVQPAAVRGRPPIPGGRAAILRAVEEAVARRDYHEVLVADVARAAGGSSSRRIARCPGAPAAGGGGRGWSASG